MTTAPSPDLSESDRVSTPGAGKTAVVLMGVAGSGKTTMAEIMSHRLGWPMAEADKFHPAANVAKMHAGIPLTDEDREPWLEALRDWITTSPGSVILTCSALRRRYRDVLRSAAAAVVFVHLDGDHELIRDRITARKGHFMPPSLLDSQFDALEPLQADEPGFVIDVALEPEQMADIAMNALQLRG